MELDVRIICHFADKKSKVHHLLENYHVPGTALNNVHILVQLKIKIILREMCIITFRWHMRKPSPVEVTNWPKVTLLNSIGRFLTRSDGHPGLDHPTCTRSSNPIHCALRPVNPP